MRIEDYAHLRWLPRMRHLSVNSRTPYAEYLKNHIVPAMEKVRIGQVTAGDVELLIAGLEAEGLAASTTHTIHAVLSSMLEIAVKDGLLAGNPAKGIKLPPAEPPDWDPPPADAVAALAESITPRFRVAVWLAAGAGLREGEALGLLVPRVDFLRRKIDVRQQLQNGVLCPLKTRKVPRRTVPVDDMVIHEINRHIQQFPNTDRGRDLLITNDRGMPVSRSLFGRRWRRAVEKAGLPEGTKFHSLRHWCASCLIASGMNVKSVQSRLGHTTAAMTLDTYSHLWPDDEERGRGVIESMFTSRTPRRRLSERSEAANYGATVDCAFGCAF
jgi:integrase